VFVRNQHSITTLANVLYSGDMFGEIALLHNCKRTATVMTRNYSTLAYIEEPTFKDMIQQFNEIPGKFKKRMKTYDDKLIEFLKKLLRNIDYMK
jgi:CRP-like cAMP-binding protein